MRIKHIKPRLTYVALVCFTAAMWRSHKQDDILYKFEQLQDGFITWNYEDYNGPAAELNSDYAIAFDNKKHRTAFLRSLKKELGKHVRLVTTLDVTS